MLVRGLQETLCQKRREESYNEMNPRTVGLQKECFFKCAMHNKRDIYERYMKFAMQVDLTGGM